MLPVLQVLFAGYRVDIRYTYLYSGIDPGVIVICLNTPKISGGHKKRLLFLERWRDDGYAVHD